jgi:hypothetical protein
VSSTADVQESASRKWTSIGATVEKWELLILKL